MVIFNSYVSLPEGIPYMVENKSHVPNHQPVGPLELKNIVASWCPFLIRFSPSSHLSPQPIFSIYIQPKRIFGDIWLTNQQKNIGVAMKNPYSNGYHMDILCFNGLQGFNGHDVSLRPKPPGLPQRERSRRSTTHPAERYKCSTWRKAWIFGCFLREIWGVQPTKMWHKLWTYAGF